MEIFMNQGKDSTIEPSYLSKTFSDKSGGPILIHKNINENGNYSALADGIDGYSSVTVEVSPTLENKTVTPITSEQTIAAGENYEGLGTVIVEAVTSAIDANITAGNIKKDVQILGVTGSYEGSSGGYNATLTTEKAEFNYANDNLNMLVAITIPSGATSIGDTSFQYCTSLTAITIPSSVTSIGDAAFSECTSLANFTIPSNVISIGTSAFDGCTGLTAITIPSSVTSMGDYVFEGCTSLANVTISEGVEEIGGYAFNECTSLTGITIPSSVTSINAFAFRNCTSLANVTISEGVEEIGDYVFEGCTSLTGITIPSSVTSMGDYVFKGCTSLTTITINKAEGSITGAPWGADNATVVWNGE